MQIIIPGYLSRNSTYMFQNKTKNMAAFFLHFSHFKLSFIRKYYKLKKNTAKSKILRVNFVYVEILITTNYFDFRCENPCHPSLYLLQNTTE